jgi:hypothetical protein
MISVTTIPARQWVQLIGLGLALAVVIMVVLALVLPVAALVLAAVLLVAGVGLVLRRVQAVASVARATVTSAASAEDVVSPPMLLTLGDGELLSARAVVSSAQSEHTLVLTRRGYVLIDSSGEVFHQL